MLSAQAHSFRMESRLAISRARYAAFERFGVFRILSRDDAWSDVEFAPARAAALAAADTATA